MKKPDLKLVVSNDAREPPPGEAPPEQVEMPFAIVNGEPITQLPRDLYIPPQALEVFLEAFEGPLDLLLYLIRRQNLDILDIPLAEITRQYMEYIEVMQDLQLELAGEYLVMAATLAEIKSRMLLPRPKAEGDGTEEDPRAELVRRLQEYERFKRAAEGIDTLPRLERDTWTASAEVKERQVVRVLPEITLQEMLLAFKDVLKRSEMFAHHHISRERLSVRARMADVLATLENASFVEFIQLFRPEEGRMGVTVTFMALLELVREGLIDIVQAEPYAPLHVRAAGARKLRVVSDNDSIEEDADGDSLPGHAGSEVPGGAAGNVSGEASPTDAAGADAAAGMLPGDDLIDDDDDFEPDDGIPELDALYEQARLANQPKPASPPASPDAAAPLGEAAPEGEATPASDLAPSGEAVPAGEAMPSGEASPSIDQPGAAGELEALPSDVVFVTAGEPQLSSTESEAPAANEPTAFLSEADVLAAAEPIVSATDIEALPTSESTPSGTEPTALIASEQASFIEQPAPAGELEAVPSDVVSFASGEPTPFLSELVSLAAGESVPPVALESAHEVSLTSGTELVTDVEQAPAAEWISADLPGEVALSSDAPATALSTEVPPAPATELAADPAVALAPESIAAAVEPSTPADAPPDIAVVPVAAEPATGIDSAAESLSAAEVSTRSKVATLLTDALVAAEISDEVDFGTESRSVPAARFDNAPVAADARGEMPVATDAPPAPDMGWVTEVSLPVAATFAAAAAVASAPEAVRAAADAVALADVPTEGQAATPIPASAEAVALADGPTEVEAATLTPPSADAVALADAPGEAHLARVSTDALAAAERSDDEELATESPPAPANPFAGPSVWVEVPGEVPLATEVAPAADIGWATEVPLPVATELAAAPAVASPPEAVGAPPEAVGLAGMLAEAETATPSAGSPTEPEATMLATEAAAETATPSAGSPTEPEATMLATEAAFTPELPREVAFTAGAQSPPPHDVDRVTEVALPVASSSETQLAGLAAEAPVTPDAPRELTLSAEAPNQGVVMAHAQAHVPLRRSAAAAAESIAAVDPIPAASALNSEAELTCASAEWTSTVERISAAVQLPANLRAEREAELSPEQDKLLERPEASGKNVARDGEHAAGHDEPNSPDEANE